MWTQKNTGFFLRPPQKYVADILSQKKTQSEYFQPKKIRRTSPSCYPPSTSPGFESRVHRNFAIRGSCVIRRKLGLAFWRALARFSRVRRSFVSTSNSKGKWLEHLLSPIITGSIASILHFYSQKAFTTKCMRLELATVHVFFKSTAGETNISFTCNEID